MLNMKKVLEWWVGPQQTSLERMEGQRKWSQEDSLALWTARYCGQVATAPPDPLPTVLSSIF